MSTSRTVLAVLATAVLATACSPGGADSVGSAPPAATAPDAVRLPLDAYQVTTWESGQVIIARGILIARCQSTPSPDRTAIEQDTLDRISDFGPTGNKRRYGIASIEDATRYGYHLPSTVGSRRAPPARPDKARPECVRAADAELGDIHADGLAYELGAESYRRSLTDPVLVRVMRDWSECMRAEGLDHPTPMAAIAGFDLTGEAAGDLEITTATADVRCKERTGLMSAWRNIEAALQATAIAKHETELTAAASRRDRFMARVAETIRRG